MQIRKQTKTALTLILSTLIGFLMISLLCIIIIVPGAVSAPQAPISDAAVEAAQPQPLPPAAVESTEEAPPPASEAETLPEVTGDNTEEAPPNHGNDDIVNAFLFMLIIVAAFIMLAILYIRKSKAYSNKSKAYSNVDNELIKTVQN